MHRKRAIILILMISLVLLIPGCSTSLKSADLMADIQAASWSPTPDLPDSKTSLAINGFAAGLFLSSADNAGNVMVSPASVFLALAMTMNGADTSTKAAMLEVLAGQNISGDMINKTCRDWITLLAKPSGKTTLSIANSIWFNQGFQPDKPFLQRNADFFNAGVSRLDFQDKVSVKVINAWIKEATRGTIEKIIEEIPPTTVMYLINSIYFKSDWQTPFAKEETRNLTFHTPKGAIETAYLHRTGKMSYFTGDDAQGVALPFDNGQFIYFALLPEGQETPREWLSRQDQATLFSKISGLMAQKSNFTVELAMPKFESSYEDVLNNELTLLGMGIAFDPGQADFSQLNEQHSKGLYISEVKHKTFIRVDEKGTEAAAVTSVAIDESAVQSDKQLTFDRPFIYGILDHATGIPLFVGIMEDPSLRSQ